MGRKIGHPIRYDERLSLQPYMSDGAFGPSYSLYGVICHAGGGPNSGHYYAHVKDSMGTWHEMNDETVTRAGAPPLSLKNAYVLFYLRDKGQALESAILLAAREPLKGGLVAGMKRRKLPHEADEDTGVRTPGSSRPTTPTRFIGPLLPSPTIPSSPSKKRKLSDCKDPQAEALSKKIETVTGGTKEAVKEKQVKKAPAPVSALQSLAQYADDDDDEDEGEAPSQEEIEQVKAKLPVPMVASAISASSFYGDGGPTNPPPYRNKSNYPQQFGSPKRGGIGVFKRKRPSNGSPFDRLKGNNNLRRGGPIVQRYGRGKKRMII